MAEDLDQNLDQIKALLRNSKLSDTDVQILMSRLTPVYKDGSISIAGNADGSVITTGDHNQVTINKGVDPTELLDELNRIVADNQGINRRELLDKLNRTIDEVEATHQRSIRCKARSMLITSVGIGVFVSLIRFFVGIPGLELPALDGLMAAQAPFAQKDSRILVIAPNDEEVQQQGSEIYEKGVSFTDDKLAEVLEKIGTYHPLVIGLDLERPFKAKGKLAQILNPTSIPQPVVPSGVQSNGVVKKSMIKKGTVNKVVAKQKQTVMRKSRSETMLAPLAATSLPKQESLSLIGGCKALETKPGPDGETVPIEGTEKPPPPEIATDVNRVGFVDFVIGVGSRDIFRRQILAQEIPPNADKCKTTASFSVQIANQFLLKEHGYNKLVTNPKDKQCPQFLHPDAKRSFTFPYFETFTGGYQGGSEDSDWYGGCKMLINYGKKQINKIELTALLNKDRNKNALEQLNPKPKIIVVGSAAHSHNDIWLTPIGEKEGAMIQALTVSQIIDTVLGEQRLIWVLPQWADVAWILGWSLLGGVLGWRLRFWSPWLPSLSIAVIVLYLGCGLSFWFLQLWLPLIPSLMTIFASASGVAYLNFRLKFGTSNPFQILRAALIESK